MAKDGGGEAQEGDGGGGLHFVRIVDCPISSGVGEHCDAAGDEDCMRFMERTSIYLYNDNSIENDACDDQSCRNSLAAIEGLPQIDPQT